ncbi:MAG TPA: hypothetical protein VFA67_07540 [Candidatus Sulfotelmatobacter sp.]|nr:hypothetical protein [Candidatus Sulfotelmatobacter sp.]
MPISAVDTISLAFQHTKRQLAQPFRFAQWVKLAFVGFLAGELGGSFNLPSSFKSPNQTPGPGFPKIDPAILGALIAVLVITGLVLFVVFTYISSVMRFVLFDSVLTRECRIRAGWSRRQDAGWKLFLWHLGFTFLIFAVMVILIGIPALFAFANGWFRAPKQHVAGLVLTGIVVLGLFLVCIFAIAVVHVFTKDFVVPQMALEGIGAIEGWRRLWAMMQQERNGYAIYAVMKVVLAIGAGIIVGIATFILVMMLVIPAVATVLVAVTAGKTAGLTWNVFTVTAAVVVGCILLAILIFLVSLISVPVIVFFPAYAMYFFAPRYRQLSLALYPPPAPPLPAAGNIPPPEPPPFTPNPAPAG